MSSRVCELIRRTDNGFVAAELHSGLRPADLLLVERSWSQDRARLMAALLQAGIPRAQWPQSLHWDWSAKAPALKLLQATGYGVVCGGEWQGLMMTKSAEYFARLRADAGKPIVYVDFLEAAPWNWRIDEIKVTPRFKAVGSVLFREAVTQSLDEGFHGRVGLHALPQAESYYEEACGMVRLGADPQKQGLVYFEFGREEARQFLSKGGTT